MEWLDAVWRGTVGESFDAGESFFDGQRRNVVAIEALCFAKAMSDTNDAVDHPQSIDPSQVHALIGTSTDAISIVPTGSQRSGTDSRPIHPRAFLV